jgi:hypothetical protein
MLNEQAELIFFQLCKTSNFEASCPTVGVVYS